MSDKGVEAKPYHHGDLRRALVEAAERILENEGPSALSLRAVAREAGVSAAAPYHHFKDKNELLAAIAQEGFELLAQAMREGAAVQTEPRLRLNSLGVAYVRFARDNPALYNLMYSTSRERDQRAGGPFGLVKAAMLEAGAGQVDAADLELAQIAAWCTAHGLAEMSASREFDSAKARLGGDEAFFAAVLSHLSLYRWAWTQRVFRFAPSPTGYLHAGHAFSALIASETAKALGGRFILRIEDIDETRCRPEYEAAIYEDLAWLGLEWETPVRRQSDHIAQYGAVIDDLARRRLVYRCFRTRREVIEAMASAPHGPEEVFRGGPVPDEADRLAAGEPFAWRLSLDAAKAALGDEWNALSFMEVGSGAEDGMVRAQPDLGGDVVLGRKDVGVAYHLAVVVDDAGQGVTDVVRGVDLFEATHTQRVLQALLALPTPVYLHHRLLNGPDGKRLAKRDKAQTLRELRAKGVTAADLKRAFKL